MRKVFVVLATLFLGSTVLVGPAAASSGHVIKKTSNAHGTAYLAARLASGHSYRLEVSASGHQAFKGSATQTILGVFQKRLISVQKPLKLQGTTPKFFSLTQSGQLSEWLLALQISLRHTGRITVRLLDVSSHK